MIQIQLIIAVTSTLPGAQFTGVDTDPDTTAATAAPDPTVDPDDAGVADVIDHPRGGAFFGLHQDLEAEVDRLARLPPPRDPTTFARWVASRRADAREAARRVCYGLDDWERKNCADHAASEVELRIWFRWRRPGWAANREGGGPADRA